MSTAADDQFYREYILDHYKNPRNYGRLEHPDIAHEEDNPLCGDVVGMDFRIKDGVIDDIRFHGRGCAISQASASLLTERIKGLSLEDARKINKDDVIGELGIDISPARIKCALLSLMPAPAEMKAAGSLASQTRAESVRPGRMWWLALARGVSKAHRFVPGS